MVIKTVTHRRSATIKCRGAVRAFSTFCIKNDIWFKKIHNTVEDRITIHYQKKKRVR